MKNGVNILDLIFQRQMEKIGHFLLSKESAFILFLKGWVFDQIQIMNHNKKMNGK